MTKPLEPFKSNLTSIRKMVLLTPEGTIAKMFWENRPDEDFKEEVMARWGWTKDMAVPWPELRARKFHIVGQEE